MNKYKSPRKKLSQSTMSYLTNIPQITPFLFFTTLLFISTTHAALFEIRNECSYTVWAAASPGGGRRLNPMQSWTINVPAGTAMARIWGRTNCNFDGSGRGRCQTGDCGGVLECRGWGVPPNTLAEYALNQFGNLDFYDISLVDGFNIPMVFGPTNGCHNIRCTADINGQCPGPLRAPGGCNNPCTVFKTNEYCCTQGQGTCGPTTYSRFFKDRCRDSYSYPQDDRSVKHFYLPGWFQLQGRVLPQRVSSFGDGWKQEPR